VTRDDRIIARCVDVTRTYPTAGAAVQALVGASLDVAAGAMTVLLGPSGSGKSTLLRLLAGVDSPDAGQVLLHGQDVATLSARARRSLRRRHVGYVFQDPADNLLDYLTVTEHLALGARLRGRDDPDERQRLLAALGIAGRADHLPRQLSGGEQQRVAIGFAVVGGPTLLVADEPTAQLDHAAGEQVLAALRALADLDVAVVAATHDPVLAEAADAVIPVVDGRTGHDVRGLS
jgi:ABC-type lipoprotein export system ATPase subunit